MRRLVGGSLERAVPRPASTDESIVLFLAEGLQRLEAGGCDGTESITIHEVSLAEVAKWLALYEIAVDLKLWAGLFAAHEARRTRADQS